MLEVFFGNDAVKVRREAFARIETFTNQQIETVDKDNYQSGMIVDLVFGQSLFGDQNIYLLDTPSSLGDYWEEVVVNLASMQASTSVFIVIENNLLAGPKKILTKYADSVNEFKANKLERFNNFALADALASKDKKSLWILFNTAKSEGISLEEMIGILWWQLKTLRLVATSKNEAETELKPFVYSKAKRSLVKFKTGELENLSRSLLSLSHDSRLGMFDLDQALERWILKI